MGAGELPGEVLIAVRVARPEDAAALARLSTQLGYPADATVMPARLARLASDGAAQAFVAVAGDDVVGMATIHLRYTMNHESPIAQLTLLVVDEANRTRDVGRRLVSAAEEFAKQHGAKRINVTTALHCTAAMRTRFTKQSAIRRPDDGTDETSTGVSRAEPVLRPRAGRPAAARSDVARARG